MANLSDLVIERRFRDLSKRVETLELLVLGAPVEDAPPSRYEAAASQSRPVPEADEADEPRTEPPRGPRQTPEWEPRTTRRQPVSGSASFDFERLIGGKTFAVLGAGAVVIAAALFLKLAYDRGWLGNIPDGWKCVLSALFGGALLAAGEFALRRWGRLASMGLTAGGLGVVYASAFAAYGFYHLVSAPIAFVMLAGVVALGIGLSARARRLPVAILSTIAGYAIPFALNDSSGPEFIFPAHLLAMLVVALALCAKIGHSFAPVRTIAWWATLVLGGLWMLPNLHDHPFLTLGFLASFWALVHGELIWSCARDDRRDGTDYELDFDNLNTRPIRTALNPLVRPMLASFSLTAWATLFGAMTLKHGLSAETWHAPAALFVATGLLWLVFAGGLRVLRDSPRTRVEALGIALASQSGALFVIAGALALTGFAESLAGLALGVGAIFASRWLGVRAFRVYGVVVLLLATGRLLAIDFVSALGVPMAPVFAGWESIEIGRVLLTRWTLLATLGALAWFIAAALVPSHDEDSGCDALPGDARPLGARFGCAAVGAGLVVLGFVSEGAHASGLFAAWLACGVAFAYALRPLCGVGASAIGLCIILLSSGAWAVAWPVQRWDESSAPPLLDTGFVAAALLFAGLLAARVSTSLGRRAEYVAGVRLGIDAFALILVFMATSAETARIASIAFTDETAKYASLTVWWAVFATALIVAGFVRTIPAVRHIGLALLCVAAGKAVIYDLAEVEPAWRIASFLGVGLLMLGVATGYMRIARGARKTTDEPARLTE